MMTSYTNEQNLAHQNITEDHMHTRHYQRNEGNQ